MKVFISYTSEDLDSFRVPEIADFLESQADIERVYYYDRDCVSDNNSIPKFMETSIQISEKIIFVCSEFSANSLSMQEELDMAVYSHKIRIPIFRDLEDVRLLLKVKMGVQFIEKNFEGFLERLYFILTGQHSPQHTLKQMSEIIPIYNISNELVGKITRKEIHEKPLWHKTSLIFVVKPNGKILYIKRSEKSFVDPNKFDCFGGHLIEEDGENLLNCAKRELAEELGISEDLINDDDLIQIGEENQFQVQFDDPYFEYEMSTLFLFFISQELMMQETLITQESFGDEYVQLLRYEDFLDQLVEKFKQDFDQFANGISRVLPEKEIIQKINQLIQMHKNS